MHGRIGKYSVKGTVYDPMGFSKIASAETLAWYRAAELKHSRVAMVRTTHAPSLGI